MMGETVCALVPIKSNSERVPEKNFRDFNGKPLYHWILQVLEAAKSIDKIVINTDSQEIQSEAPSICDCKVIERPEHLRGDDIPMNDILLHDVEHVSADLYLQTHCTNPLLTPSTIEKTITKFIENDSCCSLFTVTPLQTRLWDGDVEPINHQRDQLLPTQELSPVYEENSNIYIFTRESIGSRGNRIGDNPIMFPMDSDEAVDIDEMIDFEFAELLHQKKYGTEPTRADLLSVWDEVA